MGGKGIYGLEPRPSLGRGEESALMRQLVAVASEVADSSTSFARERLFRHFADADRTNIVYVGAVRLKDTPAGLARRVSSYLTSPSSSKFQITNCLPCCFV